MPEVPTAFVTLMSTIPVPAGIVAAIDVSELTVKLVAAVAPKLTTLTSVKFVPVIVTVPPGDPRPGLTPVTIGYVPVLTVKELDDVMPASTN